ncbi:MAG: SAM-dependent methyltransferase [Verrucomicrobia bacterium]|nr:SAM-dependent methyltransferase [Verrucomicrobiota bacterium]
MLYLFPNLLADLESHYGYLPGSVDAAVAQLTGLIAEHEKEGRRFLRRFSFEPPKTFRDIPIRQLNEHSTESDKKELVREIRRGGVWGLVSDCGMPCLADPGADLVLMAREQGIAIQTFAGPSSILFALVLSGLGGQHFTFHGYLPKEEPALIQELKRIEKISQREKSTHLFIETPYRNVRMLDKILSSLEEQTWLSIACDLSTPAQFVQTRRIKDWKMLPLQDIDKRPAVFVIRA